MKLRQGVRLLVGVYACVYALSALAVEPYQEYRKRIEAAQNMTALKDDLFGESVSLYNGKTDFQVTDVDLPGNNSLPVRLQRRFSVELHLSGGSSFNANLEGAGGWDVDVPYISGTFSGGGSSWAATRCTGSMVPTVPSGFAVTDIWQGNTIHIPSEGDRTMLGLESTTPRPSDGITRKWTTAQRDAIDCIPMVAGLSGEGFRVTTVNGVKYFFNHAVSRYAGTMRKTLGMNGSATASRTKIYVLATRVEDRFGNWVQYQYDGNGHPTKIWSNDGREVVLAYSGSHLSAASAHGRTWIYGYGAVGSQTRLTSVTLPDGSAWGYGYSNGLDPPYVDWDGNSTSDCSEQPPEVSANFTLTATHPSGATGTFVFANARHYRSGIHRNQCFRRVNNTSGGGGVPENSIYYELGTPNFFDVVSLFSKTISGPGIPSPLIWNYQYGGGYQPLWGSSGGQAIYPCTTCVSEKLVTVIQPDQTRIRYRYGFQYALNEGKLLGSSKLDAAGTVLSTQATTYMTPAQLAGQPFAPRYGIIYSGDDPSSAQVLPELVSTVQQDGATFQKSISSFDNFARPLSITRAGPSVSRTEAVEYYDDLTRWILGQTASVTCVVSVPASGICDGNDVVSSTTFDVSTALPVVYYSFGKLNQTVSYHSDGTVAVSRDGNNNATTLTNWKRGIPQTIQHAATSEAPSGALESAIVNDSGWITSITDENGYKTCYDHDAMGRLSKITHPSESVVGICDDSAWAVETFWFGIVPFAEHGLAAGHWTSSRRLGNRHINTYYDALWRPVLEESLDYGDINNTLSQVVKRYDQDGRLIFQSYPKRGVDRLNESQGIHTIYDALGRVTSVSQDSEHGLLTTQTEYLPGFQTRVTNPRAQQTQTIYQVFDQPTYDYPAGVSEFGGDRHTEIYRDPFGKVTALRRRNGDASKEVWRHYVYDQYQQLCKTVEPETGATIMDYDGAGNLQWSASGLHSLTSTGSCDTIAGRDSGRKVTRYYDARNRLKTLDFPGGSGNQSWEYWPDGLPYKITTHNDGLNAGIVENTYAYNKRRMLTGESSTQLGWYTWGLGYAYDANGSLSTQTYPTGLAISYAPNALGQATQARDQSGFYYASGASYYPNGALKQFTYGNGIVHSMSQNARQLPQRVLSNGGVVDLSYFYDPNGNVSVIADEAPGRSDGTYSRWLHYDGLDRLTDAGSCMFGGDCWHRFTYDALDNMKSWKLPGVKDYAEYVYNAQNQLVNVKNSGGASVVGLEYEPQGNLANKNGQAYLFDYGNRLRSVVGKENYRYDGHGRRVLAWDVASTQSILSIYSNAGQIMYGEDYKNGKNQENIYLAGSIIAIREWSHTNGLSTKYQHTDALGSPVAVTDAAGTVIERNDYEPYGAVIGKPNYQGIGYTGHVQDGATGLTYMQQRYYDPMIGRMLSVDPVTAYSSGDMRHFNVYAYTYNNPYKFTDPDGRCPFCPNPAVIAQARAAQANTAAQSHASGQLVKMAPKGGIVEAGGTAAAGTGQYGGAAQASVGALNNGNVTANAIYVTGGVAAKGSDGSNSFPSSGSSDSTFVAGASKGVGFAAGLTNASTGADLEGPATLYQVNTPTLSVNVSVAESGVWTATVGTPDAGVSVVKQPVVTKVILDQDKK